MTTPVIMAYVPGSAHVGAESGVELLPWWSNNQVYNLTEGNAADSGARQWIGYPSGDETLSRTEPEIGRLLAYINTNTGGACCMTYSGHIAFVAGAANNSSPLALVRAADLSFVSIFGLTNAVTTQSDGTRILFPYSMAPLRWGGANSHTDYVVSAAQGGNTPGEICVLTVPGWVNGFIANTDEPRAACGRGEVTGSSGNMFVLAKQTPATYAVPSTVALGLYRLTADALGLHWLKLGTVSPAQVDATWTHFTGASGCLFDQTDGNPIIQVVTTDAVANQCYFVKLSKVTAAVIWKCAVNAMDAYGDANFCRSNIVNQTFFYMGSANLLYTINTNTGAATTATIGTFGITGAQISDDVSGSLFGFGTWSETTTHPTYAGTYMGTLGNHAIPAARWIRYFPAGVVTPPQPPAPPPGQAAVSINRAWSFVVDGHWFYVLDLGLEGTWLYDKSTKEWSKWYTTGFVNWDVANGTMWGQRIVGCDLATNDVWEVSPTQLKDNGSIDVVHVVSGAIQTRSRDYTSCDVVRVSASIGLLDDAAGATFNLRFSDDNGQSWSSTYSVNLTQGNTTDEIAFRSLGSFNAPGRVFEFSDTGGLIRIDGADMNPEVEEPQSGVG